MKDLLLCATVFAAVSFISIQQYEKGATTWYRIGELTTGEGLATGIMAALIA